MGHAQKEGSQMLQKAYSGIYIYIYIRPAVREMYCMCIFPFVNLRFVLRPERWSKERASCPIPTGFAKKSKHIMSTIAQGQVIYHVFALFSEHLSAQPWRAYIESI